MYKRQVTTRIEDIKKRIADGWKLNTEKRWFEKDDAISRDLLKTEVDFAIHIIAKREGERSSEEGGEPDDDINHLFGLSEKQ